ncbi:Helicase and polymerase-containing protein TEBICHI [Lachnellula arida]|uniref:Helicase and polymerase-containing protein TEBICHI n=1 Tax=Lachnellula arida TaxID=1316785 RepID=A0A8T9BLP0_9HELO|nr:Helicase and polymerase-containing protein TEBICHI [Lachnellula arida]
MDANKTSNIYHKTTIDVARAPHTTLSHIGRKRTFDESHGRQDAPRSAVLADISNHGGFQRPTLQPRCFEALKASEIQDVCERGQSEYTQRRGLALTPTPTSNPLLDLSHPAYGLPAQLVRNFADHGVKSIYPWQSECLLHSGALGGERNLVYTAPTGGGKSLVADILMLRKVLQNPGQKALLVLPYVALVQEKLRWLRQIVDGITKTPSNSSRIEKVQSWRKRGDEDTLRVVGLFGGSKSKATWVDIDIAVCTIEKANSLVNAAIEEHTIGMLGAVIIDELHMIDDESRGYILELMATKLLSLEQNVQLIGMSATLNWLNGAKFYISRYRPVPIEEHLVFDNSVYHAATSSRFYKTATQLNAQTQLSSQVKPEPVRIIHPSQCREFSDPLINAVVSLASDTAKAGYGALVFCSSRAGCERDAILISQVLPRPEEVDTATMDKRMELLNDLRSTSTGLDATLEKTILVGVAFHHAGLTAEERDLIATAYDLGVVKIIVATCSLAAGINLPARRVILHGARMGADFVGPSMLRQMRGRAGRKGKDEIGETYLCCKKSDLEAVAELMEADIPNVESCLLPGKRGIKRALLEVIAIKLATCDESVNDYMRKTLLYHSVDSEELGVTISSTLDDLSETGLVQIIDGSTYAATTLGEAIVASSLTPEDGLFVHRELLKALQGFAMDSDLHALYTFTPVQTTQSNINWQIFRQEVERLDESNMRALQFVGLKPMLINKMAHGGSMKESTPEELETVRVYKRFYSALQLRDLCNEMPIHTVARKYDIPRGNVQNLAQTCHGFAAGIIKFCQRMGWGALAAVLDHYSDRLRAGAKSDLLALAEITYIKSRTARVFWENGYRTVAAVATADPKDLLPVFLMAQPRKPNRHPDEEDKYIEKLRGKVAMISISANKLWERQMQQELDEEE